MTEVCGLPSALMVASTAGFGSSRSRRTAWFSEIVITADDLTAVASNSSRTRAGDSTSTIEPNPARRCAAARSCSKVSVTVREPSAPAGPTSFSTPSPNTSGKMVSASSDALTVTGMRGRLAANSADHADQNALSENPSGRSAGVSSTRADDIRPTRYTDVCRPPA
jgi:hypothetical protein